MSTKLLAGAITTVLAWVLQQYVLGKPLPDGIQEALSLIIGLVLGYFIPETNPAPSAIAAAKKKGLVSILPFMLLPLLALGSSCSLFAKPDPKPVLDAMAEVEAVGQHWYESFAALATKTVTNVDKRQVLLQKNETMLKAFRDRIEASRAWLVAHNGSIDWQAEAKRWKDIVNSLRDKK